MGLKDLLFGKSEEATTTAPADNTADDSIVKIYTMPACGYCKQVKRHLSKHNIPFKEINLKEDKDGQKFMNERGYTGVPVTVIKGEEIVGFDLDRVNKLLDIQG